MVDNQLQRRFENTIIRTVEVQPTMTIAMVNKAHLHLVSHLAELSCASAATIPDSTRNTAGAVFEKYSRLVVPPWQMTSGSTSIHPAVLGPEFILEFKHSNVVRIAHYLLTSHFLTARKFLVAPTECRDRPSILVHRQLP